MRMRQCAQLTDYWFRSGDALVGIVLRHYERSALEEGAMSEACNGFLKNWSREQNCPRPVVMRTWTAVGH